MIQPLKSARTTWFVYWVDLEEPLPTGNDYFLPTLLIVCDRAGVPIASPDILEDLDQLRVENFLLKLIEKEGPPDRITVCAHDDWEDEAWKAFSHDNHIEVRFRDFERSGPEELRALARTVVMRFSRDESRDPQPKEVARGLVNTALRTRTNSKKHALLRAALARDPDCSPARIELADMEYQKGNWRSALSEYEEVIAREFPRWEPQRPQWWQDPATRPLLRSLYGRGMTLWHQGHHTEAASQFEHLLGLNPEDNQGARFFIPLLHLLDDNLEATVAFFARYESEFANDYSEPALLFGWALCRSQEGDESGARDKYREGILKNIYIAPMLLEEPELPRNLWHPNDRAEPNYGNEFIDSYAVLWDRETGALRLLREVWEEIGPRVTEVIAHRQKMADFQDQRYAPDYKSQWKKLIAEDERLTLANDAGQDETS
jgi:tetratricopeptide (TPR) repeat protein